MFKQFVMPETMFYLYEIRFPNAKKYIGWTVDLKKRMRDHERDARNGCRLPVHCAMRHFAAVGEKMVWEPIGAAFTRAEIAREETREIKLQNTMVPNGYNATPGGDGVREWSAEQRAAMSLILLLGAPLDNVFRCHQQPSAAVARPASRPRYPRRVSIPS